MKRPLHCRAATFLSTFVLAAGLMAGTALASTPSPHAPPPPPDEGPPPQQMQQANPVEQFRQTLQQFGSFHTHPLYGEVWKPSEQVAPPGWSPYPVCHWQFDREQRTWVFNDPTEWGSIVHRHGRWANDPQHGWVWVADANAGPGWVIWRNEARSVSWAPMLPEQHGNQPPRDGWQTQDQATFNSGCRNDAPPPPAPSTRAMHNPAPMPMMAPAGPAYVPGGPVFIPGGGTDIVFIERCRRNPWLRICRPGFGPGLGGLPAACSSGIRPSWCRPACATRPWLPGCRAPAVPFAGRFSPPGATPGPLGSLCARNPAHPACRPTVRPIRPGIIVGRPIRPIITRPIGHGRIFARPGSHRPFVGGFRGGHRMAMGHRGGRSFRR
jgi:hypothetical protein